MSSAENSTSATAASPTNSTTQQPAAQGTTATAPAASPTTPIDNLQCQWKGCGERATSAEALYEHVCERHVGRKSTNNLCLTCSWGNCTTSTVKRDHITSHIRVHVPLKPHKCDFCGKSFKRPQDLKKHVKTHADDSVIMRSPHDAAGGSRAPNGYGGPMGGPARPTGFYPDGGMPGGVNMAYGYQPQAGSNGYYAPTAGAPVSAGGHYGQVYYNVAPLADAGHGYDARKAEGLAAMNNFFGAIKARQFDTSNYGGFSQHLMALQNLQLPLPVHSQGMSDYAIAHGGGHGGVYGPTAHHAQNLPSLSNLRTKADLSFLDEQLTQMTQAAYEAQSMSGSHSGYPIPTGIGMRQSHSPPMHHHSAHANQVASAHSTPPALTPGSSAMSYTSGHSPTSVHSNMVSPSTTGANYPTLPGSTTSPTSAMAPTSALGGHYDQDRRRYSGGNLQRAQPPPAEDMEVDAPASTSSSSKKHKTRDANIDPALAGSPTAASTSSDGTATPTAAANEDWVHHMRLLESLSSFVKTRLERHEYEDETEGSSDIKGEDMDTEEREGEGEGENLYPKLSSD